MYIDEFKFLLLHWLLLWGCGIWRWLLWQLLWSITITKTNWYPFNFILDTNNVIYVHLGYVWLMFYALSIHYKEIINTLVSWIACYQNSGNLILLMYVLRIHYKEIINTLVSWNCLLSKFRKPNITNVCIKYIL